MTDSISLTIAKNFQLYLDSLSEEEVQKIDSDFITSGLASIQDTESAHDLLALFDIFYFVNGRFPTATGDTFVPKGDSPLEVNDEEVNIKKIVQKIWRKWFALPCCLAIFSCAHSASFLVEILKLLENF